MRSFFDDIVTAIKTECPNARISWDISAWLTEPAQATWWGFFASSTDIDYIHTSGSYKLNELFFVLEKNKVCIFNFRRSIKCQQRKH